MVTKADQKEMISASVEVATKEYNGDKLVEVLASDFETYISEEKRFDPQWTSGAMDRDFVADAFLDAYQETGAEEIKEAI